jgi:hypothetical protein
MCLWPPLNATAPAHATQPIANLAPRLLHPSGGKLLLADPPNRARANRERFLELLCAAGGDFLVEEAEEARVALQDAVAAPGEQNPAEGHRQQGPQQQGQQQGHQQQGQHQQQQREVAVALMRLRRAAPGDTVGVKLTGP